MPVDLSKLAFLSSENYMKREDRSPRYQDVSINAFATKNTDIEHNLGFEPEYDVWADLLNDGRIWTGNLPEVGMEGFYTPAYCQMNSWTDDDKLTVSIYNPTGSTKTVRIYYLIFQDYA